MSNWDENDYGVTFWILVGVMAVIGLAGGVAIALGGGAFQ